MTRGITPTGVLIRFVAALVLVTGSYNPSGYSYFHWLEGGINGWLDTGSRPGNLAVIFFFGVVLSIGWAIFLRATLRSLGGAGLFLAFAFFGALFWLTVYLGIVPADNETVVRYVILVLLAGVLGIGLSWSHIRRRVSGQLDTDDVETG